MLVHIAHIDGLVIHTAGPERQPAEPGFKNAKPNIWEAIHDARSEESGYRPHGAPGMGGQAGKERVIPQVAIPGIAKRIAMVDDCQPVLLRGRPDRLQVWMVERVVKGQMGM